MISQLLLTFDNTDPKLIGIRDASSYNEDIEVQCPIIVIQAPGYTTTYTIDFTPGSFQPINSNNIGITKTSRYQDLVDLPDGVWYIKYSIQPHEKLYTEHLFYRTSQLRCSFYQALLSVDMNTTSGYKELMNDQLEQLMIADFHIKSAEANLNSSTSNELLANKHYTKAKEIIEKILKPC